MEQSSVCYLFHPPSGTSERHPKGCTCIAPGDTNGWASVTSRNLLGWYTKLAAETSSTQKREASKVETACIWTTDWPYNISSYTENHKRLHLLSLYMSDAGDQAVWAGHSDKSFLWSYLPFQWWETMLQPSHYTIVPEHWYYFDCKTSSLLIKTSNQWIWSQIHKSQCGNTGINNATQQEILIIVKRKEEQKKNSKAW
jgi:hypothetical protein